MADRKIQELPETMDIPDAEKCIFPVCAFKEGMNHISPLYQISFLHLVKAIRGGLDKEKRDVNIRMHDNKSITFTIKEKSAVKVVIPSDDEIKAHDAEKTIPSKPQPSGVRNIVEGFEFRNLFTKIPFSIKGLKKASRNLLKRKKK